MSFGLGFPRTRQFFDPPTLWQIIAFAVPMAFAIWKERTKIVAWFEMRGVFVITGPNGTVTKEMTFHDAAVEIEPYIGADPSLTVMLAKRTGNPIRLFIWKFRHQLLPLKHARINRYSKEL
jgi:hypothetical protein